jgi:hypothetical protein
MPVAPTPAALPQVALYLDIDLSRAGMAHVIDLCSDHQAHLLILAPPPHNLAVSRLEPHLGALARAGIDWSLAVRPGSLEQQLQGLDGIVQLVCDSRSALAHRHGPLPAALRVLLAPATEARPTGPAGEVRVDWLAPRFNRGY